ncbi:DUF6524 family protein [Sulfurivermis fontis]|uniref:DUF6524 family protein n=1 Tax=Sulfurivermis fontis TaxID=1972068 RepID=UPI000FDBBE12|nr:DUF6524 family protein [Sulfurivermis fontis]
MAVVKEFNWVGFLLRLLGALVIVFATYNPSGYSYLHWVFTELSAFNVYKALAGITLVIGWVVYLGATGRSLGAWGVLLATAFFGTLIWLVVDLGIVPADSAQAITWLILIVVAIVLATGMSWSHIRRRLSGQADVDDVED